MIALKRKKVPALLYVSCDDRWRTAYQGVRSIEPLIDPALDNILIDRIKVKGLEFLNPLTLKVQQIYIHTYIWQMPLYFLQSIGLTPFWHRGPSFRELHR